MFTLIEIVAMQRQLCLKLWSKSTLSKLQTLSFSLGILGYTLHVKAPVTLLRGPNSMASTCRRANHLTFCWRNVGVETNVGKKDGQMVY